MTTNEGHISENSRRIARNTAFLYFRMLLILVITLYTSRLVLSVLGIVDYGIYDVVSSVVAMFSFINGSMVTSTQRYLTFAIGKGDPEETGKVFSNAVRIHLLIGIVIVILCETIGVWMVNHKLVIPEDRLTAANWVFQLSLLSFFINVTQVPYNAIIIAKEKMNIFAYISIADALLKLGIVFLLPLIPFDKLIVYAILSFLVAQTIRTAYRIYCRRSFEECRSASFKKGGQYREMLGFAGWNMFGSIAWMLRDQGVNVMLNIFFGPAINAARGLATKVSSAVQGFVSNFTTALNPQITKNYAQGNISEMEILAYRGSRFSFLVLFIIALPLMLTMDTVLGWWLKEVPESTGIFLTFILIDSLINAIFSSPLITSLMATGDIKKYQVTVSSVLLLVIPVGYVLLKSGCNAYSVFIVICIVSLLAGFVRYMFCARQIGFKWSFFLRNVIVRAAGTVLLSLPVPLLVKSTLHTGSTLVDFLIICSSAVICEGLSAFIVGITKEERDALTGEIHRKLSKNG